MTRWMWHSCFEMMFMCSASEVSTEVSVLSWLKKSDSGVHTNVPLVPVKTANCTAIWANPPTAAAVSSGKQLLWWYSAPCLFWEWIWQVANS